MEHKLEKVRTSKEGDNVECFDPVVGKDDSL